MKIYCIGAGGGASYLLPVLARSLQKAEQVQELVIIDRDKLEARNVERQLFTREAIGAGKAETLAAGLQGFCPFPVTPVAEWFTDTTAIDPESFIICLVDNHVARLAVLEQCDQTGSYAVIGGNELWSADAYYYDPLFKGTAADPRIRYPEILTDKSDDPTRPPCNDAGALAAAPQSAHANSASAMFCMQLIQLYLLKIQDYDLDDEAVRNALPVEYSSTRTGIRTVTYEQLMTVKA
jgi:molybdopterin/thiamine biosynthesis adenylyltransferase